MTAGTGSSSPASRLRGPRIGLLLQLVAPDVILTLVLVLAVTYIVTGLVTSSARLGFDSQLQAMLDGAGDGLAAPATEDHPATLPLVAGGLDKVALAVVSAVFVVVT